MLQVVGIIESHARAVDLMTHNYYELLYAFHIYRHNYRKGKAGGGRLGTTPPKANCKAGCVTCRVRERVLLQDGETRPAALGPA